MNLNGGTINGGTLTTTGGGVMYIGGSTLNGVTISTGSTVTALNGSTTTLQGTITNNGTIALNSTGSNTSSLGGNVTLERHRHRHDVQQLDNIIYGSGGRP